MRIDFCIVELHLWCCQRYKTYLGLHVKHLIFLSNFNQTCQMCMTDFNKSLQIKFHENLSNLSHVISSQTDWKTMKLIVAFATLQMHLKRLCCSSCSYYVTCDWSMFCWKWFFKSMCKMCCNVIFLSYGKELIAQLNAKQADRYIFQIYSKLCL